MPIDWGGMQFQFNIISLYFVQIMLLLYIFTVDRFDSLLERCQEYSRTLPDTLSIISCQWLGGGVSKVHCSVQYC